jgi:hypothetical protein
MSLMEFKNISFTRVADNTIIKAKYNPNKLEYSTTPTIIREDEDDVSITTVDNEEAKKPNVRPSYGTWSFELFYDESEPELSPLIKGVPVTYEKIVDKIAALRTHLLDVVPSEHESAEIQVKFGSIEFTAFCTSFSATYNDFDISGEPLTAEVKLSFQEEPPTADVQSPDITHLITFRDGDHLSKIAKKIYGSTDYITQVAQVNKLHSFRGLDPGVKLYFPPLQS